jgi:hypothetical protein
MQIKQIPYHNYVFGTILVYLAFWYFQGHFLSQLQHPVLINPSIDNTYWILCILRIPQTIIQFPLTADLTLVIILFVSFITKSKWSFRFLVVFYIVYISTFNVYTSIHTKACLFFIVAILPFCFNKFQSLIKDGVRYYFLYVLVSAAIFKIINGGLFHPNQLVHILENQHTSLSILNPSNIQYQLSLWLIKHTTITNFLWICFFLMEAIFIIGFFTKKYDFMLLVVLLIIIASTYIVMRIVLIDFILAIPYFIIIKNKK